LETGISGNPLFLQPNPSRNPKNSIPKHTQKKQQKIDLLKSCFIEFISDTEFHVFPSFLFHFIGVLNRVRIHRARIDKPGLFIGYLGCKKSDSPIQDRQHQRQHRPSCLAGRQEHVCTVVGPRHPWVHQNEQPIWLDVLLIWSFSSMSMERFLVANASIVANIQCLRL
jgi:hypothetical protein